MPAYTVHVSDPGARMYYNEPLGIAETCRRLRELKEVGFEQITITDHTTGERTSDVDEFLRINAGA